MSIFGFTFKRKEFLIVVCIIIFTIFAVSPNFFSQLFYAPKDHVFVGMTVYFEDFYYYLDQFRQGADGNWLVENRFTSEIFPPTLIYFPNLLMGKIGGLFGLEPFQSYNYFALLFKSLFIISSYLMISKLIPQSSKYRIYTFLIFIYSTSFPNVSFQNGRLVFNGAIDIFRAENRVMARFGASPQGMMENFLFVILILVIIWCLKTIIKKENSELNQIKIQNVYPIIYIFIFIASTLCSMIDVSKVMIIFVVGAIVGLPFFLKYKGKLNLINFTSLYMAILIPIILWCLYLLFVINKDPVYAKANEWDINEYFKQFDVLGFWGLVKGFGLIVPISIVGFIANFKKEKNIYELVALLVYVTCFGLYIIPYVLQMNFPAFRFIFPATYIFIAYYTFHGLLWLSRRLGSIQILNLLMFAYMSINLFTYITAWLIVIQPLKEPSFHFAYIPNKLYEGFRYLSKLEPQNGVVLASPYTSTDLMIPGLVGKHTYSGHFLTTYNSAEKDEKAKGFFYSWTDTPTTHDFLKKNNIRFVVVTAYSMNLKDIKTYYPFLKPVFENEMVTIFRYDPT
jgi:hypothetical protein